MWYNSRTMNWEKIIGALEKRGYEVEFAKDKAEAKSLVLKEAELVESVGWGGSESLKEIGAREALEKSGKEIREYQMDMDLFLLSANAMTADGVIVNIDGHGNRVAASICGPKSVLYVIGRNKIVEGDVMDAIKRVKKFACPPNCRRLSKKTPCAITGECADCDSPDRICKVTAIFDRPPTGMPTKIILVDEDLGY